MGPENAGDAVVELSRSTHGLQQSLQEMRAYTDGKVKEALTLQVNRNRSFLDELARFIDTLQDTSTDTDEDDEDETDDEEETVEQKTGRAAAMQAYQRSLRALARSRATGNSLKKGRRSSRIVEWLGDRGMATAELAAVGRSLVQQSRVRKLLNPARSFITEVPRRYRSFRRQRQGEGSLMTRRSYSLRSTASRRRCPVPLSTICLDCRPVAAHRRPATTSRKR